MFRAVYADSDLSSDLVEESIRLEGVLCTGPFVLVGYAWYGFMSGDIRLSSDEYDRLSALYHMLSLIHI